MFDYETLRLLTWAIVGVLLISPMALIWALQRYCPFWDAVMFNGE